MSERYLIPRRITQRWELFPGWGKPELLLCLAGAVVGAVLAGASSLLGLPFGFTDLFVVLPVGGAAVLAMPQPTGDSLIGFLTALRAYRSTRHLYLFDHGRDDA